MVEGILEEVLEFQATLEEGYGRLLSFDAPTFLRIANVYREHDYWIGGVDRAVPAMERGQV